MSLEKSSKESLCKVVNKHVSAQYLLDQYLSILYQFTWVIVYHINVFYTILTLKVSCQGKARSIVTEHFHLSDGLVW